MRVSEMKKMFECDFESFKKNVIDEIKQMHDEQREKGREIKKKR